MGLTCTGPMVGGNASVHQFHRFSFFIFRYLLTTREAQIAPKFRFVGFLINPKIVRRIFVSAAVLMISLVVLLVVQSLVVLVVGLLVALVVPVPLLCLHPRICEPNPILPLASASPKRSRSDSRLGTVFRLGWT